MNGKGACNAPSKAVGSMGMYACDQCKGYNREVIASAHNVSRLYEEDMRRICLSVRRRERSVRMEDAERVSKKGKRGNPVQLWGALSGGHVNDIEVKGSSTCTTFIRPGGGAGRSSRKLQMNLSRGMCWKRISLSFSRSFSFSFSVYWEDKEERERTDCCERDCVCEREGECVRDCEREGDKREAL